MRTPETLSGGCQCGAVRFSVETPLRSSSVCHCRMCQKAFGGLYGALTDAREGSVTWTRGAPRYFRSSQVVRRGFCGDCGTPLTYEAPDGIALAIGAFDDPEAVAPTIQYGIESRLSFTDDLHRLPVRETLDDSETATFLASVVSNQHPDHDTDVWPDGQDDEGSTP